jgi:IS1 family transposase
MNLRQLHPQRVHDEQFGARDKTELTRIVGTFDNEYGQLITDARDTVHELERQLTRARHELARLERHQSNLHRFRDTHQLT